MQEHTAHLGTLNGRLLIFGGVYSNYQALEALQQVAKREGIPPNQIICTGDVVAYCADPEASVRGIRDWGIHCIAGNVELQLATGADVCGCNFEEASRCDLFSKNWYPYAQEQCSSESLAWMAQLPQYLSFNYANKACTVLHGAYEHTSEFIFKSTPWARKAAQFEQTQSDVILCGHAGIPFSEVQQELYWLNAGVIGMPANDGQTSVWYLLLDDTAGQFSFAFHQLSYDYETTANRMEAEGLPPAYAHTLRTGIWDNCDILPATETAQRGKPLCLIRGFQQAAGCL